MQPTPAGDAACDAVTFTINPVLDQATRVERVTPDKKLRCDAPTFEPGGGGLNVARALRILGGRPHAVWTKGGPIGDLVGRLLDEQKVPNTGVPIAGVTRSNLMVMESATGRQYRFGMPGPAVTEDELRRCIDIAADQCRRARYLVVSGSVQPGVPAGFGRMLKQAAGAGVRIILDGGPTALSALLSEGVFLVKPNIGELAAVAGRRLDGDTDIVAAARGVLRKGHAEAVAVSLGADGALLVTRDHALRVPSPDVPVASRVGAGDSMVAGLTLGLCRGEPLPRAFRFGVAAGAAAVMTQGSQLCRREDAERLWLKLEMPGVTQDVP